MYACSPKWKDDWISKENLQRILIQLSGKIEENPFGPKNVGINSGLHFTGGEPFLNFDLLLKAIEMADRLGIPSIFVETNCFWCTDEKTTRQKLKQLKNAGLDGILISVNPFILERVPFERTQRAIEISEEVFGRNLMVYQDYFYRQFKSLSLRDTLHFEEYLRSYSSNLEHVELIPMGRVPYELGYLYRKYPAKQFFGESCMWELTRNWHVHVDNYCNYMTGYCGGISLGDARGLDVILREGVDLDERPILCSLVTDLEKLYGFSVREFGYQEPSDGYVSKCHFCLDMRKHIVGKTDEFKELKPREFYNHL